MERVLQKTIKRERKEIRKESSKSKEEESNEGDRITKEEINNAIYI